MTNFIYVANIQVFRRDDGIYITDCYTTITEKDKICFSVTGFNNFSGIVTGSCFASTNIANNVL